MQKFKIGQKVKVINDKTLIGNFHKPNLKNDDILTILDIFVDSEGFQHLDVGLESEINSVTSYETGEYLPLGDLIHWCHPSRFILHSRTDKFYEEWGFYEH